MPRKQIDAFNLVREGGGGGCTTYLSSGGNGPFRRGLALSGHASVVFIKNRGNKRALGARLECRMFGLGVVDLWSGERGGMAAGKVGFKFF